MAADCVVFDMTMDHSRSELWEILGEPARYPRFFRGVSSCDKLATDGYGAPAEYALRACLGTNAVIDHRLRTVINRRDEQLVLSGVPDTGGWVSIRLSDAGPDRTQVKIVFFKPMLRHELGASWSESDIRTWARDGLRRVSDHLAGVADTRADRHREPRGSALHVAKTLISAGILMPARPDKTLRQLRALAKWGATLAGGYGAAAARSPKAPAITDEDRELTFAQVDERSTRLAHSLAGLGVGPASKVGVLARNHSAMVQTLVACGKLGADAVLLNTGLAGAQIDDMVRRHTVVVLVADDEFTPLLRYLPDDIPLVGTGEPSDHVNTTVDELVDAGATDPLPAPPEPGRLIVLTSGTTGTPKGARRPTPGLADAAQVLSRIPLRAGDRIFVAAPIFHSWGLTALQIAMPLRAGLVVQRRFDAEATLAAIAEHRCTALFAVPIMLQRILNLPAQVRARYDTSSLRIVASSGSALPGALVTGFMDTFGDILYNFYGSTEVSAASIAGPADLRAAPTTAGRAPQGTRLGLLGPDGKPVPPGVVGRIFVGNDMLFDGYTDGAGREVRNELMDTGDRGYFDADGRLFVSGRDDEMIVSGGENVFPRPVEEVLVDLPQVDEAAVIGVPDAEYGQRLVAYVVVRPGARLDEDSVRAYVHQRLARFSVPREVIFVDELPRNQTGKVLKRVLAEGDLLEQQVDAGDAA
ncbi:AMP-binding protein [Actinokineospora iranica]|uniref:Acyl-CoA synthetase (AMP-forming)/AMP-acid ligase II n=1 Tax=Actinokineospora iranica TaxID=1271860 RepID=A0A1G6YS97_9PSEU|nr:AMP-binding protein [Actinokineospora iranica]SDD93210.1 Acyl-CoA synthetase (AMP-forming)/AMP-acid ligase II [Actinokineospora iranica]